MRQRGADLELVVAKIALDGQTVRR